MNAHEAKRALTKDFTKEQWQTLSKLEIMKGRELTGFEIDHFFLKGNLPTLVEPDRKTLASGD